MNSHTILFGILLCLLAVNARHFNEQTESSDDEQVKRINNGDRHRRKRYHMSYGYDYQPPANPFYPYRRESYDRNHQDLLPEIYRLLDEISVYLRRPPSPPQQPIYIPYAVPYPVCNCPMPQQPQKPQKPNVTSRFPDMDDTNQNWGLVDEGVEEEEGDGSRPLSFKPIKPKRPMSRPAAAFDHGTQAARAPEPQVPDQALIPSMCDVFSLSCCSGTASQQRQCLIKAGCPDTYDDGRGCSQDRLLKIIDEYTQAYAPVN